MIIEAADTPSSSPAFDAFVTRHRLFFHDRRWLGCYDSTSLRQAVILNNNREIIGCFLYYLFSKGPFRFIITPPYTPDIALFFVNPGESVVGRSSFVKEVMDKVADFFDSSGAHYVNINLPAQIKDVQPLIWKKYLARSRFTYWLDLDLSEEDLRKNLSSEKRKSLAKAEKDGVRVMATGDAQLLSGLVTESLERSSKNRNSGIIGKILSSYAGGGDAIAYVAVLAGKPIAATFCVVDGDKALYLFGGYSSGGHHGAGVSCMWQCILEARRRGLKVFDFEGSMDKNIERYFREFGPRLVGYHCVEKVKPALRLLLRIKGHQPL